MKEVLLYIKNAILNTEFENKVFQVGGSVRDEIMGFTAKDIDLVIDMANGGITFANFMAKYNDSYVDGSNPIIFKRFGTSKLILNINGKKYDIECVSHRTEHYSANSRKPIVSNGSLIDDVMRRDFTINTLLKNISSDEIIDITGKGLNNIKNGIIDTPINCNEIFFDDALRQLRAIRFSCKYGFKISENVIKGIKNNAYRLKSDSISVERINDEFSKILISPNPRMGVEMLVEYGLMQYIIPEVIELCGFKQNDYHDFDIFGHTVRVVEKTPPKIEIRLAALLHDIGKINCLSIDSHGKKHFYKHELFSKDLSRKILTRLKYSNKVINEVCLLVENHMKTKSYLDDCSMATDKSLRKLYFSMGEYLDDLLYLIDADNKSHSESSNMYNQVNIIRERLKNINLDNKYSKIKLPLNGNDVMDILNIESGPLVKEYLKLIEDKFLENPSISKEKLTEIIINYKK